MVGTTLLSLSLMPVLMESAHLRGTGAENKYKDVLFPQPLSMPHS